MNPFYIGTNLKMNMTAAQTVEYISLLAQYCADLPLGEAKLFVIPSFTAISDCARQPLEGKILLGAQNMCWEDSGEFTGEISPVMLREFGVDIVEIAHSERRSKFSESDEYANLKVLAALRHGMKALLCVGENKSQKDIGISDEILSIQLKAGLKNVADFDTGNIIIAYEPAWAIGSAGETADCVYTKSRLMTIRSALLELFGSDGREIPIIFGGSVNERNACAYIEEGGYDGLFVGRAAWDAERFNRLIRQVLPVWKSGGRRRS